MASGLSWRRVHDRFGNVGIESPTQHAESVRHICVKPTTSWARTIRKSCLGQSTSRLGEFRSSDVVRVQPRASAGSATSTTGRSAGGVRAPKSIIFLFACLPAVAAYAQNTASLPPPVGQPVDFASEVRPLFEQRCHGCHGAAQQMGGLRLDRKGDALRGGDSGAVIVPGESARSKLVRAITGVEGTPLMPMVGERLTPEQIGVLRAWIDQGAEWPDSASAESRRVKDPRASHWSFQPIRLPVPPQGRERSLGQERDRCFRSLAPRLGRSRTVSAGGPGDAHSALEPGHHWIAAKPPGGLGLPRGPGTGILRTPSEAIAGIAAFRGKVGPPLARPGALCRQRRLFERPRSALHVAIPRVGCERVEPGHAFRPLHGRAISGRPIAERHGRTACRARILSLRIDQSRGGRRPRSDLV